VTFLVSSETPYSWEFTSLISDRRAQPSPTRLLDRTPRKSTDPITTACLHHPVTEFSTNATAGLADLSVNHNARFGVADVLHAVGVVNVCYVNFPRPHRTAVSKQGVGDGGPVLVYGPLRLHAAHRPRFRDAGTGAGSRSRLSSG
jgi:hypothetical protein